MRKSVLLSSIALSSLTFDLDTARAVDLPDSITVTGRGLEEEIPQLLAQSGTRVETITANDIRNGGYLDVGQTLNTLAPGLYVSPKNGPFDYVDISFQGSRTADVLWLVDGIRINNRLYSFTTPLDTLPAAMVERIESVEGGQALFYGTQAAAGAINIVTKDFSEERDGAFRAGGDTNGGKHVDGFFRDTFSGHQFVLYASHDQSDGFRAYPEADYQPSTTQRDRGYRITTFGGKYGCDLTDALRFSASYHHTFGRVDFAVPQRLAIGFNNRNEDLISAKVDYAPSETLKFFLKGYHHRWASEFTQFNNSLTSPVTSITINDHDPWGFKDYGVNAMGKTTLTPGLDAIVGYDFQNYEGSDAVLVIENKTENSHAVFGQLALTPDLVANTHLNVGVRYNAPSFGQSAFVWTASGKYDFGENFFVRGAVGRAFRLPTAEELFANDPGFERGNPGLKPETSNNANVSIGGHFDLTNAVLRWEAIGFYRDIKNLIDYDAFDAVTGQDIFGNVAGTVKQRGGEFVLDATFGSDFSAGASYTYTKSRPAASTLQFNRVPTGFAKANIDYHPASSYFGGGTTLNYVGDVYDTLSGGVGRLNYGNYVTLDFNARVFIDSEKRHRVDFHLKNAFDERYTSRLSRGTRDSDGAAYAVHNLGLPRTLLANYTFAFN